MAKRDPSINVDRLRRYMEDHDLTETQFAALIGVSYPQLWRVMRRERGAGGRMIYGLLSLGIPPDELFSLPKSLTTVNDKDQQAAAVGQ